VPTDADPPRLGDVPMLVSDPSKLRTVLGVRPNADLERMVRDAAQALSLL
jgi:UDP-glucose 4-epimerase